MVGYWAVRALLGWLAVTVAECAWLFFRHDGPDSWHRWGLVLTAVVAPLHIVVMPPWRYRVHRWETSADAVYVQSGWFVEERRIAPFARVQTVDTERGPLEQIFGLTTVTATTASAAGPLKIQGLDDATGQRVARELTAAAQATQGDAT